MLAFLKRVAAAVLTFRTPDGEWYMDDIGGTKIMVRRVNGVLETREPTPEELADAAAWDAI